MDTALFKREEKLTQYTSLLLVKPNITKSLIRFGTGQAFKELAPSAAVDVINTLLCTSVFAVPSKWNRMPFH